MAWDDAGRLFVVENPGYPTGMPDGSNGGVVAMLEDTDEDGRVDTRTVFADGFTFPNGILAWDGGFFVTCAPDVYFLKDTTGDGRADVREAVLAGFDTSSSTQLRVAQPTFGPDGWVYLTSGLTRAGNITSPLHPDREAVRTGSDSRFNPFTYEIEAIDGRGQFGQSFDDWGNRFHNMNRVHIQHTVLPSRFLKRNPNFAFAETVQNVPEGMVDDLLKSKNVAARTYPISDNLTTADSHAGTFSAACGVLVYRGDSLPVDCYGDVFTCDPTGNLVHRDRLTQVGPTFSSRMVNEGTEFLASRDNSFRPVNLATGPDGALYIADMYRGTIEHPDYLPEEVRKRTDFDAGRDRGRIWKIRSVGRGSRRASPARQDQGSAGASPYQVEKLVSDLGHPNVWQRERAMKAILANEMTNAVPLLLDLLPTNNRNNDNEYFAEAAAKRLGEFPRVDLQAVRRVNALNTLMALTGWDFNKPDNEQAVRLPNDVIRKIIDRVLVATVHPSPAVRLAAWFHLRNIPSPGPEVADAIMRDWANDPNPAVRFNVALTLGQWEGGYTTQGLIDIGLRDGTNKWTRAAFLSGIQGRETTVVERTLQDPAQPVDPQLAYALGDYFGGKERASILADPKRARWFLPWRKVGAAWQLAAVAGLVESVGLRELVDREAGGLVRMGFEPDAVAEIVKQSEEILQSDASNSLMRQSAATVLAASGPDGESTLLDLLQATTEPELTAHVLGLLIDSPNPVVIDKLTSPTLWASLSPVSRSLSVDGLLKREETAIELLQAIESDRIPLTSLSLAQRDRLKNRVPGAMKDRATALFSSVGGDRMKVYNRLKEVAKNAGNPKKGRELFKLHCASCHRLDREGFNVGPDLLGVRNQPKEAILMHVLAPSLEVYPSFAAVTVEMKDGRSLTGIVRSENENSLTIVMAQGAEERVSRRDVATRQTGVLSLMPDGFEEVMNREQLADLLAYLKGE